MKTAEIVYQDEDICLVAKAAGLAVHKSRMTGRDYTLIDYLSDYFTQPPVPVHRLDRPTSGLLLCANTSDSNSLLNEAFREGLINKQYLAVVRGWAPDSRIISKPLNRYDSRGKSLGTAEAPQDAETEIRTLARGELPYGNSRFSSTRFSLVQAFPHTGRFHQIRRHLAGIGYPIVGDTSHGDTRINHLVAEKTEYSRLMLHAYALGFNHPKSGEKMKFQLLPSDEMEGFIHLLGWELSDLLKADKSQGLSLFP